MRGFLFFTAVLCLLAFASAFFTDGTGHLVITSESLTSIGFCRHSRDAVGDGNNLSNLFDNRNAAAHFNDEAFVASSQRILDRRARVIRLIRQSIDQSDVDDLDLESDFLEDAIAAGFDDSRGFLNFSSLQQDQAWTALGQALHTVQDFYSNTNWIELGNTEINTQLGVTTIPNPPANFQPCPEEPETLDIGGDGGSILTSGYFLDLDNHCAVTGFPGKCRHGWELAGCPTGLAKEDASVNALYLTARNMATDATTAFVNDLLNDLEAISPAHRDELLGAADCSDIQNNRTTIFFREKDFDEPNTCETFDILIDEYGMDYRFLVTLQNLDSVTLRNDAGEEVDDTDYQVIDSDDDSREFIISDPVPGTYSMEVCNTNSLPYRVLVTLESNIFPVRFYFTRLTGSRNTGEFPQTINQQPILDADNGVYAELYGSNIDYTDITFAFVSTTSDLIFQTFQLDDSDIGSPAIAFDGAIFVGNVTVVAPDDFRVRVTGKNTLQEEFFRVYSTRTYQAQTVDVQIVGDPNTFQMGPDQDEIQFQYRIVNRGAILRRFDLSLGVAGDIEGAFSGTLSLNQNSRDVVTSNVELDAGESTIVTATLRIINHNMLSVGDIIQVTMTADSEGAVNNVNAFDITGQYVACGGNPVCNDNGFCNGNSICECFTGNSGAECETGLVLATATPSPTPDPLISATGTPTLSASRTVSPSVNSSPAPVPTVTRTRTPSRTRTPVNDSPNSPVSPASPVSPNTFSASPNTFSASPNTFSASPNTFSASPNTFSASPNTFSASPNTFSASPNTFSVSPNTFSVSPNTVSDTTNIPGVSSNLFEPNTNNRFGLQVDDDDSLSFDGSSSSASTVVASAVLLVVSMIVLLQ